jgi:hypothetical protein
MGRSASSVPALLHGSGQPYLMHCFPGRYVCITGFDSHVGVCDIWSQVASSLCSPAGSGAHPLFLILWMLHIKPPRIAISGSQLSCKPPPLGIGWPRMISSVLVGRKHLARTDDLRTDVTRPIKYMLVNCYSVSRTNEAFVSLVTSQVDMKSPAAKTDIQGWNVRSLQHLIAIASRSWMWYQCKPHSCGSSQLQLVEMKGGLRWSKWVWVMATPMHFLSTKVNHSFIYSLCTLLDEDMFSTSSLSLSDWNIASIFVCVHLTSTRCLIHLKLTSSLNGFPNIYLYWLIASSLIVFHVLTFLCTLCYYSILFLYHWCLNVRVIIGSHLSAVLADFNELAIHNHLTWMLVWEDFISFSRREGCRSGSNLRHSVWAPSRFIAVHPMKLGTVFTLLMSVGSVSSCQSAFAYDFFRLLPCIHSSIYQPSKFAVGTT